MILVHPSISFIRGLLFFISDTVYQSVWKCLRSKIESHCSFSALTYTYVMIHLPLQTVFTMTHDLAVHDLEAFLGIARPSNLEGNAPDVLQSTPLDQNNPLQSTVYDPLTKGPWSLAGPNTSTSNPTAQSNNVPWFEGRTFTYEAESTANVGLGDFQSPGKRNFQEGLSLYSTADSLTETTYGGISTGTPSRSHCSAPDVK